MCVCVCVCVCMCVCVCVTTSTPEGSCEKSIRATDVLFPTFLLLRLPLPVLFLLLLLWRPLLSWRSLSWGGVHVVGFSSEEPPAWREGSGLKQMLSEGHILYMYTMVTSNCSHVEKILTYSLSLLPLFSLLLSFPGGRNLHLPQPVPHGTASLPCCCLPFRYHRLTHSFGGSLLMCIHEGARMVYIQCTWSHDTRTLGQTRKDTATQHELFMRQLSN